MAQSLIKARIVLKRWLVISQLIGFPLKRWCASVLVVSFMFMSGHLVSREVELRLKNAEEGHDLMQRLRKIYGV